MTEIRIQQRNVAAAAVWLPNGLCSGAASPDAVRDSDFGRCFGFRISDFGLACPFLWSSAQTP